MYWHRLVLSGLVSASLAGCASGPAATTTVQRLQMAEKETEPPMPPAPKPATPPMPVLDQAPEQIAEAVRAPVTSSIRATVNNAPILDVDLNDVCVPMLQDLARTQMAPEERLKAQIQIIGRALQDLIENELILQDCYSRFSKGPGQKYLEKLKEAAGKEFDKQVKRMKEKSGAPTEEALKLMVRQQGLSSLDAMRRQFERQFITSQYIRSVLEPAIERRIQLEEIRDYYDKHPEEFQTIDNVTWLDIFIDASKYADLQAARQFAELLAQRGRQGEDFAKLSAQYDQGDSVLRKGEGFGKRRGEIRPAQAESLLFSMKDGDIGPLIEMPTGFHVIKLVKREHAGLVPFNDKTQTRIREKLKEEAFTVERKRYVNDLRAKATIEYARTTPH